VAPLGGPAAITRILCDKSSVVVSHQPHDLGGQDWLLCHGEIAYGVAKLGEPHGGAPHFVYPVLHARPLSRPRIIKRTVGPDAVDRAVAFDAAPPHGATRAALALARERMRGVHAFRTHKSGDPASQAVGLIHQSLPMMRLWVERVLRVVRGPEEVVGMIRRLPSMLSSVEDLLRVDGAIATEISRPDGPGVALSILSTLLPRVESSEDVGVSVAALQSTIERILSLDFSQSSETGMATQKAVAPAAEAPHKLDYPKGIRFLKFDRESQGEERFVLGVVLEPETVDSQDDIYDAAEVRAAAHFFMENDGELGFMHRQLLGQGAKLLESYIAPVDFVLDGQTVKAGTWLMAIRIIDDALWEDVKAGRMTGLSIGGSAVRVADGEKPSN
jgi:hypothetical protein